MKEPEPKDLSQMHRIKAYEFRPTTEMPPSRLFAWRENDQHIYNGGLVRLVYCAERTRKELGGTDWFIELVENVPADVPLDELHQPCPKIGQ